MCRGVDHGGRRCPGSSGEVRNARDRVRYAARVAGGLTLPVDSVLTGVDVASSASLVDEVVSVDLFAGLAEVRAQLAEGDLPEGSVRLPARTLEKRVREIGSAVEARAAELAGVSLLEVGARHEARASMLRDGDYGSALEARKQLTTEENNAYAALRFHKDKIYTMTHVIEGTMTATDEQKKDAVVFMETSDTILAELTAKAESYESPIIEQEARMLAALLPIADQAGYDTSTISDKNAKNIANEIMQGHDPATKNDLKALADGRLAALAEIRAMGGATIATNDNSSKRAQAIMADVANYYPTDWINASNEVGNLKVKDTTGRAHYSMSKSQKTRRPVTEKKFVNGDEVPPGDGWVRGVWTGHGWSDPVASPSMIERAKSEEGRTETNVLWVRPRMKTRKAYDYWNGTSVTGPPPRGWVEAFETVTVRDSSVVPTRVEEKRIRVFQQAAYEMVPGERVSELTIDKDAPKASWHGTPGFETALHETAHRMEHVVPSIGRLEEAFLQRRTTDADGNQEGLSSIYGGRKEMGRKDSFADAYMGKEYDPYGFEGRTIIHREVMSTGMEALFGGGFGGLAGVNGKTADPDMAAFIMGVLASA